MGKGYSSRVRALVAVVGGPLAAAAAMAFPGPDVTLSDIQSVQNHGLVGAVRAYTLGSHTCNIGNTNLFWTSNGTPGLAMNLYQLHDGRLRQLGLSFVKTACCAGAQSGGCGTCNGAGGSVLGAGCLDVYSASWNSQQGRLAPRSGINAFSGQFTSFPGTSGDAAFKRLQVPQTELNIATHTGAQYFIEGVYVGSDDAPAGNGLNNATYKRATLDASYNLAPTPQIGGASTGIAAIRAWRDHGLGVNTPDLRVKVSQVNVPGEGQFWQACKVTDLGNGSYRYDYAVFNLNSDRSGGSFSIPVAGGVTVTDIGFHAPQYHSGEPYANAAWTAVRSAGEVRWATPQAFTENANSSALRWGTMYNFWFTANTAPATGNAALGLFKPYVPASVAFEVEVPSGGGPCYANCDGSTTAPTLNVNDYVCFLNKYSAGDSYANCDESTLPPVLNVNDFTCYINAYAAGCP
jgi:hypothetical protein